MGFEVLQDLTLGLLQASGQGHRQGFLVLRSPGCLIDWVGAGEGGTLPGLVPLTLPTLPTSGQGPCPVGAPLHNLFCPCPPLPFLLPLPAQPLLWGPGASEPPSRHGPTSLPNLRVLPGF